MPATRRSVSNAPQVTLRARASLLRWLPLAMGLGLVTSACSGDVASPAPWATSWRYQPTEPVVAERGMVVSTDILASQVGIDALRAGGNAVDAAVAVSFALAVVNPEAGNLGGGGFMVARMNGHAPVALDYREKAPGAASRDMYLDADGNLTDASVVGHLASGVPGSASGLWEAHQRFGVLPWADVVQPAIDLARGFVVAERFLVSLPPQMVDALSAFPASKAQFLPRDGQPPALGDTLRQPDLAATLERIRDQGPDGFYRGETADLIVAEMQRGGGLITHDDLADYQATWRDPVVFDYRGHTVISMAPSSSGGVTMAEAANIVEQWDLSAWPFDSAERVHHLAEAFRRAYSDRNHYLADPDFIDMPLQTLSDQEYADWRAADISSDAATPSSAVQPGVETFRTGAPAEKGTAAPSEGENTTHFSVVDREGNAVSVTTTINSGYGSKVTVTGAGFVLNNEMDDFAAKPGTPNQFGLVHAAQHANLKSVEMVFEIVVLEPQRYWKCVGCW